MTIPDDDSRLSVIDVVHVKVGRPGFFAALAGLIVAAVLFLLGSVRPSERIISGVLVLLIALPAVNVLGVLLEEVRSRDRVFMFSAAGVLALIVLNLLFKL